jgi:hypothetical protein
VVQDGAVQPEREALVGHEVPVDPVALA